MTLYGAEFKLCIIFLAGTKYLGVGSTPLIFQTMWDATQLVKSPDPSFKTVYDQWLSEFSKSYNGTIKPQYALLLRI